jgi:trimeric autotransporter adhesin
MKAFQTAFLLCCFTFLPQQLLRAAQPQGYVIGWGSNIAGEATGIPSYPIKNGKVVMTGNPCATGAVTSAGLILSNVVAVSAAFGHSLALCSDGTVVGFGGDFLGEATGFTNDYPYRANARVKINGRVLSNVVSVAASQTLSLALKKDGTLVTWGENYIPSGLTNITAIATEWGGSWVLERDGTVVGWTSQPSNPRYGQLLSVENLTNVFAIAVGPGGYTTRGVALKNDGTVAHWGGETIYKDATPPAGLSNVVAIAAGFNHTLALKNDGTVIGWGFNDVGQATGIPTTNAPNISAGQVTIEGQVLGNIVSIAAGHGYSMALKRDGTIVTWGRMVNDLYPATVPAGLINVIAISAGDNFCLAITTNITVADRFRQKQSRQP